MALLEVDHVTKRFGRVVIAEDLSFTVDAGETVGIVGPNGAGKTSLFGLISGDLAPNSGEVSFAARGSKDLSFESPTDMVIRMSDFVCGRTLAIRAEYSAREIPRDLVGTLKSPEAAGLLRIEVYA